jgi:steroid delta-isomerase-like uncharacterized protein
MEEIMPGENKALVHRWTEEIWNRGSLPAIAEIVAADYVHHDPLMPDLRGIDALKQYVAGFRAAFPDGRFAEDELIEEGDKVVMRWAFRGTQKGEFFGVAATDALTEITGTTTLRLVEGKVAEHSIQWDSLGWMRRVEAMTTALMQRWTEVWNEGKLDVLDEICTEDVVFGATLIPETRGCEGIRKAVTATRAGFPDVRYSLLGEPVVHGDRWSCRWTMSGTHKGDFMGVAPTGKYVTYVGMTTYRVRGGKIAEYWSDWDALSLMQQLGAVPVIGQTMVAAGR